MPSFFLRQPDGGYAVYGTIADDFILWGMTEAEAIEEASTMFGGDDAHHAVVLAEASTGIFALEPSSDGLHRWRAALTKIALLRGGDCLRSKLAEMGMADVEIPMSATNAAAHFAQRMRAM